MAKLEIRELCAFAGENEILKGVNLTINSGEIHAIMGQNGAGKSTLAAVIMGSPEYEVSSGKIWLDGKDVLLMSVDERARAGLFLGMQYPSEVSGISNAEFIRASINSKRNSENKIGVIEFLDKLDEKMKLLKMPSEMSERFLNEGFSGGEKKRNEILQMLMLEPSIAVLDEIDSGLDIDALKLVSKGVNEAKKSELSVLLITHYQRLLEYIKPDFVHIMIDGKIVKTGGADLAKKLDKNGYDEFN